MKQRVKKTICAVMVLLMVFSVMPSYAFAEGEPQNTEIEETETAQETPVSDETQVTEETGGGLPAEPAAEAVTEVQADTAAKKQEQADTSVKEEISEPVTEVTTKEPAKVNETAEAESKTEEKKETTDAAEAETPKTEFSYKDSRVTITATAPEEANLPQDAELKADYLKPGSDEYKAAVSSIEAQLTSELKADQKDVSVDYVLYDIYFLSTSENKRIEPEDGKVKAEMTIHALQKTAEDGDIINKDVVHLKDNGTAEIVTDYINTNADGEVTSMGFTQSSFSVTGGAVTYSAVEENAAENNDGSGDADGNEPVVLDENDLDGTDLSTVGKDNLNITITPSADPLPKDNASISGRIEYTIPNTMKDKTSPYTAHYNLPTNYLTFTSSLSGTIYAEDGTNIGSYVLDSATGLLTLTFGNESYYEDHTNISGYFNFKATVDTNQIPDESDAKWEFPGYGEITVPVEEGKISGSKQVSDIVFDEDGQPTLPYTISLYANSSMTGVMLTDILGTNQEFIEGSWSVKDSSGNKVHFDCNIDGTTAILTNLGDDNDGDGIYTLTRGNYTITYRALIKDVNNIAALTNTATWKWDGGSNTSSTTKEVSGYSISKDDTNFSGNSASWRVLINKGTYTTMEQMANATLTDTLPEKMQLNEESIIIKDTANNWQVVDKTQYDVTVNENNGTFTIQFHRTDLDNKNIPQYEIIYKTELKDNASLENNEKVENTVEFKHGGTEPEKPEPVKDTGTGTYIESTPGTEDTRVAGAVFKNVTNVNYDDGNAIADWRITINQYGNLGKMINLKIEDGYRDYDTQGSTKLVRDSVVVTIKENGSDKVLTTDNYDLIQNDWGLFFKLTFKGDYASGIDGPITITCKTITNGDDLKNNASTYETYITNHVKVSWDGHYDEDSDSFHYKKRAGELEKRVQRETDGTYIWTIIANYGTDNGAAIDLGTGTITVTDILPSGMSYVEDSGQYSIIDSYYNIQEWDHSLKNGKAITPLKTGNVLTFTVNNVGKNYIAIQYKTKINEGYMDDKGDVDFTNYASYSDSEGVINSGSATVTEHGTAIKKTGELTDDHQQVLYTITVNPDKKTLNDGKDLILKDTLPSNGYYVSGSLKATEGEIISSRYMDGKLYITVPDETKVVLTYLIAPNRTTDNSEQITLNNTVSVEGHDELTSSVDDSYNFDESTAGAGGSNDALFIKKIDSETQKSLEGAEFELHRMAWSEALQTYIEDINFTKVKGITNENGLVEFTELGHDEIYYYIETAAPNGYERDTARHYFWFRGNDAETIRERIASSGLSVNEIQPGFIVVGNDKVETGRITVTKKVTYNGEPDKVTEDFYVALFSDSNGEKLASEVKMVSLKDASEGTATFDNLTVGNTYYVYETDKDGTPVGKGFGYEVKDQGQEVTIERSNLNKSTVIINDYILEKVEVSGRKTWDDANNQDGKRPASITINLLANGVQKESKTVTEEDNWSWSFTNLPKYEDGKEIIYTITEDTVPDYMSVVNGYDVTNSYTPGKTSVTVTKSWQDNNDQDGIRPNAITVKLLADEKDTGKTLTLNEANNWSGSFTDLAKYKDGEEISYTVEEAGVEGYEAVIEGNMTAGYVITNSHTPETTEVSGRKTWDDANNQDGKRPASITINLLANGVQKESKTVTEEDNWSWSFTNLPKYENGKEITYTITEDAVPDYTIEIDGYDVTNSYTPGKTSVTVTKSWNDADNQDGKRPDSIQVQLYADGKAQGEPVVLNAENNWSHIWSELDEKSAGNTIKYTVKEVGETDGKIDFDGAEYQVTYTGDAATGYTIVNSYTTEKVEVSGSKTWEDKGNEGARPESITIRLYADNKEIDRAAVTAENDWSWSFENLPKYRDGGQEIIYTISEDTVDNYITEVDGYNVTNKYQSGATSVSVAKRWDDSGNRDGKRPDSVKVQLYADGEAVGDPVTLNKSNDWRYTWSELNKQADGKEIAYTVKEVGEQKGTIDFNGTEYKVTYTGNAVKGYTITNSYNAVSNGVQTGDDTNMRSNLAVMFAATAATGAVLIFRRRRYNKE